MKRLLVATDFSVPAENAARYAIKMAKQMNASVTLINAYTIPLTVPNGEMGDWPVIDNEDVQKNIGGELDLAVKKLLNDSDGLDATALCPKVDYRCQQGDINEVLASNFDELGADLIIMGLSGAGGLINFMLGSKSLSMAEHGKHPMLLIPFEARFKPIKKIAYAGTLSIKDIQPLKQVCQLAASLGAEVLILHVADRRKDLNQGHERIGADFAHQLSMHSGCNKVSYQPIWNKDTELGLEWIAEQENIDIVCLFHQRHSLLHKIVIGSKTKRLARYIHMPLLIFPPFYSKQS